MAKIKRSPFESLPKDAALIRDIVTSSAATMVTSLYESYSEIWKVLARFVNYHALPSEEYAARYKVANEDEEVENLVKLANAVLERKAKQSAEYRDALRDFFDFTRARFQKVMKGEKPVLSLSMTDDELATLEKKMNKVDETRKELPTW